MRLAARLSKALGIELVDAGDSMFDLVEHAQNREHLQPTTRAQPIAEALLAGARERDLACISAAVSAMSLWGEPDLEGVDSTISYYGRWMNLEDAAIWVPALVEANDFETLEQLAGINGSWEPEETRAVCFAVLPLGVALDGAHAAAAADALQAIARRHHEHAADLPVVVPRLCEMLGEESAVAAARALGSIGDRRAVAPLIAALRVVPHASAWGLVAALRELHAREAVPALTELMLVTTDQRLRDSIYHAVATLDRVEAANAVARCADPDRMNAFVIDICAAGAAHGDALSRQFLERARRSADQAMRAAAVRALRKLDR